VENGVAEPDIDALKEKKGGSTARHNLPRRRMDGEGRETLSSTPIMLNEQIQKNLSREKKKPEVEMRSKRGTGYCKSIRGAKREKREFAHSLQRKICRRRKDVGMTLGQPQEDVVGAWEKGARWHSRGKEGDQQKPNRSPGRGIPGRKKKYKKKTGGSPSNGTSKRVPHGTSACETSWNRKKCTEGAVPNEERGESNFRNSSGVQKVMPICRCRRINLVRVCQANCKRTPPQGGPALQNGRSPLNKKNNCT